MSYTKIAGTAKATVAQMQAYIKDKNSSVAQSVIDMIPYYLSEGAIEGIRGDIAFAQSCLETGNFGFSGSAVTLDQNNFCGMGVTSNGVKGNSFSTPQLGIRAQIQHLKAYANTESLVSACIDPRFKYVTRGCAQYVEWLGIQENPNKKGWASGANYGSKILTILNNILAIDSTTSTTTASTELYRVRKSWDDSSSQIGAYTVLDNAKTAADKNPGYYVYDSNGKQIYPVENADAYGGLYRVRSSWVDATSQKGAYSILDNAIACCDANNDTFVFVDTGICIYPLPYTVTTNGSTDYYADETGKTKAGTAARGVYTITEVDSTYTYGKLKSGAGWLPLAGLTVGHVDQSNYLTMTAQWMPTVYNKIVSLGCTHKSGATTYEQIISKKTTTCAVAVSAVLQKAGVLKSGKLISHTAVDGSSGDTKTSITKAISGTSYLIGGTYDIVRIGKTYTNMPSTYKKAGIVYVQDFNICMCAGDGSIYSCNNASSQISNGKYIKDKVTSGYPFTSQILYAIVPRS